MLKSEKIKKRRKTVKKMMENGLLTKEIANKLNLTERAIQLDIKAIGLHNGKRTNKGNITLNYQGLSPTQIAFFNKQIEKNTLTVGEKARVEDMSVQKIQQRLLDIYKTSIKDQNEYYKTLSPKFREEEEIEEDLVIYPIRPDEEPLNGIMLNDVIKQPYGLIQKDFPKLFYALGRVNSIYIRPGKADVEDLGDAFADTCLLFGSYISKKDSQVVISERAFLAKATRIYYRTYVYKQQGLTVKGKKPQRVKHRPTIKNKYDQNGNNTIELWATNGETPADLLGDK